MLLSILLPICLLVGLGFIATRSQFITAQTNSALGQFVMKVSLPAFLIQALASKNLADIWHPQYFIGYAGGSLLLFIVAWFCCRSYFNCNFTESSVLAIGGSMSNTGFIGVAILTLLLGSNSAIYLSMTLIIENLIMVTLMLILAEHGLQQAQNSRAHVLRDTLKRVAKNPVIVSIVIGISCVLLNVQLPDVIAQVLKMLGQTAAPLALFVIGGSLVGMQFKNINQLSVFLVAFKVLLMPCFIFACLWLLGVSSEMLYVGTLLAALPMPIAFGIFAQHYAVQDKALAPLVLSTVVGFIVVALILSQSKYYLV